MSDVSLGVDVGTEAVRALLVNAHGTTIQAGSAALSTTFPKPGRAEQDPQSVWDALVRAVSSLNMRGTHVRGIALASTSVTVMVIDHADQPLGPAILWMDTRATAEAQEVTESDHPALWYTGGRVSPEWMLPKALWLMRREPARYSRAARIVELHDWLMYRLTGRWVASLGLTCSGWSYVPELGGWPTDLLADLGLARVLETWPKQPLMPGEAVATLCPEAAASLELDTKVLVCQGTMDTFAAAIACNVFKPGRMAMSLGSSSSYVSLIDRPRSDPRVLGPVSSAFGPSTWTMYGGQTSAGSVLRWFQREMAPGIPLETLDEEAAAVPLGANGVRAIDTFQGSRTPRRDPARRGALWGLRLSHTRAAVYRALLESVALGGSRVAAVFSELGIPVSEIVASGGGSRSPIWMQIHADAIGRPILALDTPNAAALGAAICAAVGAGGYGTLEQAATAMAHRTRAYHPELDATWRYASLAEEYREVDLFLNGRSL